MWQLIMSGITLLLFLGFLNLLAGIGLVIRRGMKTKEALKNAKAEAIRKGFGINQQKYNDMNFKASLQFYGPIVAILFVYAAILLSWPENFFFSLLGLIPIGVGLLGYVFVPGDGD